MRTSTGMIAIGANAPDLLLLNHAQQLHLEGQRCLGDLVEKQSAPGGRLDQSVMNTLRAGERALLMAKEFAFENGLGEGAAVDRSEGMLRPLGVLVDGARDQFFSGATRSEDEHVGIARRDSGDGVIDLEHSRASTDDGGAQRGGFSGRNLAVELGAESIGAGGDGAELLDRDRLTDVFNRALGDGLGCCLQTYMRGDDDEIKVWMDGRGCGAPVRDRCRNQDRHRLGPGQACGRRGTLRQRRRDERHGRCGLRR